jgi:hypothetical protein
VRRLWFIVLPLIVACGGRFGDECSAPPPDPGDPSVVATIEGVGYRSTDIITCENGDQAVLLTGTGTITPPESWLFDTRDDLAMSRVHLTQVGRGEPCDAAAEGWYVEAETWAATAYVVELLGPRIANERLDLTVAIYARGRLEFCPDQQGR